MVAIRLSGSAYLSSVPDQSMPDMGPLLLRHDFHQVSLDFDSIFSVFAPPGKPQPSGQAADVRIHDDTLVDPESGAEYHIGRFSRDAGKRSQALHGFRDFPCKIVNDLPCCLLDVFGFLSEEAGRVNDSFHLLTRRLRQRLGRLVLPEENRCDLVDGFIRGLGRQDRGHEKLIRTSVRQGTIRFRV